MRGTEGAELVELLEPLRQDLRHPAIVVMGRRDPKRLGIHRDGERLAEV
jgi:hypothetical protein